jgi:hypothetical protein
VGSPVSEKPTSFRTPQEDLSNATHPSVDTWTNAPTPPEEPMQLAPGGSCWGMGVFDMDMSTLDESFPINDTVDISGMKPSTRKIDGVQY